MAKEAQNGAGPENGSSKTVRFTAVKPKLFVEALKAKEAVQFYKSAFGAEEANIVSHLKRKADQELPMLLSAELKLGSSSIIVSELTDEESAPVKTGTGCVICLETEDVDAAMEKAVNAGAVSEGEIVDGDSACCAGRVGKLKDPYGFVWHIYCPVKKVADVEA